MTRTTTIEFEFEWQVIIGQLDPHGEISFPTYFSINRFYSEFADKQSDLLEYKDAENIAIDFRNDLRWKIRDTVRRHFAQNKGVMLEDVSMVDSEFDDYVYISANLEETIDAMAHIQIVLNIEDKNAFDRNKLLKLVENRFFKQLTGEPKYVDNVSVCGGVLISDFIER
jgi:hypothetical protein